MLVDLGSLLFFFLRDLPGKGMTAQFSQLPCVLSYSDLSALHCFSFRFPYFKGMVEFKTKKSQRYPVMRSGRAAEGSSVVTACWHLGPSRSPAHAFRNQGAGGAAGSDARAPRQSALGQCPAPAPDSHPRADALPGGGSQAAQWSSCLSRQRPELGSGRSCGERWGVTQQTGAHSACLCASQVKK